MIPSLGESYDVEIETISKPHPEYRSAEYTQTGLPAAPAIMVGDELLVQGRLIDEHTVASEICGQLGLQEPQPPKKGFLGRLVRR